MRCGCPGKMERLPVCVRWIGNANSGCAGAVDPCARPIVGASRHRDQEDGRGLLIAYIGKDHFAGIGGPEVVRHPSASFAFNEVVREGTADLTSHFRIER